MLKLISEIGALLHNHGKAVTLDVNPVWPAQPTCGVRKSESIAVLERSLSERSTEQALSRGTASQCFSAPITNRACRHAASKPGYPRNHGFAVPNLQNLD